MSHITTINVKVKDLSVLKQVATKLGLELVENQKTFSYYNGRTGKCEHVLKVKGNSSAYQIGLVLDKDGVSYNFDTDFYSGGRGLVDVVGQGCEKLINGYAVGIAKKSANELASSWGATVIEEYNEKTGETQIILRRY